MALQLGSGEITITAAGGAGSKTYAHGLSFTPTLMLWFGNGTAAGSSLDGDARWMFGATQDSTHEWCQYGWSDDANASSSCGSGMSNNASIAFAASATTYDMQADFTSVDGTNFTFNVSDAPAADVTVQFFALAGDALNIDVGTITIATGTTEQTFAGVTSATPKLLLWGRGGLVATAVNTVAADVAFALGATSAVGTEITMADSSRNAQAAGSTHTTILGTRGLFVPSNGGAVAGAFNVTSLDATGFKLTPSTSFGGNRVIGFVAISGANFSAKVGTETMRTTVGTKATTGVGFKPQALITLCNRNGVLNTNLATPRSGIGVAHGSSNRVAAWADTDAQDPTNTAVSTSASKNILDYSALTNAVVQDAALSSFDADGFTENVTTSAAAATIFGWIALRENAAPVITSNGGGATAAVSVAVGTQPVTTVTATDADNDTITYSISGGADQASFSIVAATGVLTFAGPAVAGTYVVIVQASDGVLTDTQTITVTVPQGVRGGGGALAVALELVRGKKSRGPNWPDWLR